jgi:peptidoglycan/LPS O-acetylase OafA/YrhL
MLYPERLQFLGNTPLRIFWHGEGAVIFFFLISGFVLSHQLSNVKNILKSDNYIKYVLNRINRIYPAFFIMIVISLVMRKYMSYESYEMVIPSQWFSEIILTPMSFSLFIKEALVVFPNSIVE